MHSRIHVFAITNLATKSLRHRRSRRCAVRHRCWLVAGFLGAALMTRVPNLSAQSPPPATANGKTSAAVVAIQESNPTSPEELITAINQLVVFQELELAKRYAASLDQIDLQSDNLAALGETIGSLPLLHIIGNKQLDQKGRDNCQKILDALITKRTSPERLARLAREATSDDPRKRQHAITDLRVAGPGAIVPLVAILADPRQAASRDAAVFALYQMGDQTIAPLLAVLESADEPLKASILEVLGRLKARRALYDILAAAYSTSPPVRAAGRAATGRAVGTIPPAKKMKAILTAAVNDYLAGRIVQPAGIDGLTTLWRWDAANGSLTSKQVEKEVLAANTAHRIADALWQIDPSDEQSRQTVAITRLERDKLEAGLNNPLDSTTRPFLDALFSKNDKDTENFIDFIETVFEEALHKGYLPAAIAAAEILEEEVVDENQSADLLFRRAPQAHPLVEAAEHSNRRLRMAATRALLKMEPDLPFVGASAIAEALRFFANVEGRPHLILADRRPHRRTSMAALLKTVGYEIEAYKSGDEAFLAASKNPECEAIFLSMTLGPRSIQEVLHELRLDPRTADLPVALVVDLENRLRAEQLVEEDPLTLVFFSPRDAETARHQVSQLIAAAGINVVSQQERLEQASEAIALISILSKTPSGIYDLTGFDRMLNKPLHVPSLTNATAEVLGNIGSPAAQTALVDAASRPELPIDGRKAAAAALRRSMKDHGIGLTIAQIQKQKERYDQSVNSSPEEEAILWSILDTIGKSGNKQ